MFNSISPLSPQARTAIEQLGALAVGTPHDPRVNEGIGELQRAAADVARASAAAPEPQIRSAGNVVADGLLAAAAICRRLQEG